PPVVTTRTTQVELARTGTGLVPGAAVLVTGRAPTTGLPAVWPRALVAVAEDTKRGTTRVAWAEPIDPSVDAPIADASLYAFAASTALFGADAAEWASVRDAVRLAVPTALGPPVPPLGGVVRSADDGATWTAVAPLDAIALATTGGIALVGTATGLYVDGVPNQGIPRRPVLWVGGTPERLFATQAGTVWQSLDRGRTWDALAGGPPVLRAAAHKKSHAKAAETDALALTSLDPTPRSATAVAKTATPPTPPSSRRVVQRRLPNVAVRGVVAAGSVLIAATDGGAYHYLGGDWRPDGLAEPVLAMAVSGGRIWAATAAGVRVRSMRGSWSAAGSLVGPAYALAASSGRVVAATAHGVHVWTGSAWRSASEGLPPGAVMALAALPGALVAAPANGGLYRSIDLGASWQRCDAQELWTAPGEVPPDGPVPVSLAAVFDGQGVPLRGDATIVGGVVRDGATTYRLVAVRGGRVRVLREGAYGAVVAFAVDGRDLLAAAPYGGPAATEWPGYGVCGRSVDLAKVVPGAAPGTYALLDARTETTPAFAVAAVTGVERPAVVAYGSRGTVSRLLLDEPVALGAFSRRAARVWTGAAPIPLFRGPTGAVPIVDGDTIPLAQPLPTPLPAGRTAIVVGQPVRLALAPAGGVAGLVAADVRGLAVTGHGDVVAASAEGVHVLPGGSGEPLTYAVAGGARAVVASGNGSLAATGSGVVPVARGLGPAVLPGDVIALTAGGGRYAAATAAGEVAVSTDGTTWESLPPLPGVTALAVDTTAVYALTPTGVARCAGQGWIADGPGSPQATALAVGGGRIWAAAPDGLWSRNVTAGRWRRDPDPLLGGPVLAVAPGPVAVTAAEVLVTRGARWEAVPLPKRGVPVAVATGADGTPVVGYAAATPVRPSQAGRGYAYLFATAPLAPVDVAALGQGGMPSAVAAAFKEAGTTLDSHTLSVTARGSCWVVRSGASVYVLAPRTDGAATWAAGYAVIAETVVGPAAAGTWPVAGGSVSADPADVILLAAAPDETAFAEVVTIAGADSDVRLTRPLEHVYDAATVALHLNVAAAMQGRPVMVAIGSGDPRTPHQSFAVPSPVASVDGQGKLRVLVGGTEWKPVANLDTAGPADHVYVARHRPHGSVTVTFGDGIHGARLPAGHGNVMASYVDGGGAAGEAAPGELIQPLTRPQLVTGVVNPVAALRPATAAVARIAAAASALGRAVSVADALVLAAAVPGVASVSADLVATEHGRAVVVTVASATVAPPALAAEVGAVLAAAGMRAYAVAAERLPVAVSLAVVGPAQAYAAVRAAVLGLTAERPGVPLHAAAVVAAATGVAGIAAARVTAWSRSAQVVTGAAYPARGAGWQPTGVPRPAELVVVGDADVRADLAPAVTG
ncbi:MAG: hypothetical protein JO079_12290, partial [Frankiaceae bacterium]|nr:hypothetical protein [Frankiaceae bacterium]